MSEPRHDMSELTRRLSEEKKRARDWRQFRRLAYRILGPLESANGDRYVHDGMVRLVHPHDGIVTISLENGYDIGLSFEGANRLILALIATAEEFCEYAWCDGAVVNYLEARIAEDGDLA